MRSSFITFVSLALSLAPLTRGQKSGCQSHALPYPPADSDIAAFTATKYDYLVVGGGTAGMVLAGRLAANANLKIGVIEAGPYYAEDFTVNTPQLFLQLSGNPKYDWNLKMEPQAGAAGRVIGMPRGKMLGGSSGINYMAWNRASATEYNAWSQFAPGNNWDFLGLLPYFNKAENIRKSPGDSFPGIGTFESWLGDIVTDVTTGSNGPIQVQRNWFVPDIVKTFVKTLNSAGIRTNPSPQSGIDGGVYDCPFSVDNSTGTRSYAAQSYYCKQPKRSNLQILTGAQASKVTFNVVANPSASLTANGVEFYVGDKKYTAKASKEVIISTGTVGTPQLLELSGIGDSSRLSPLGIKPLINLPYVGENLQEHLFAGTQWQLNPGQVTFDKLRNDPAFATDQMTLYNKTGTGLYSQTDSLAAFIPLKDITDNATFQSILAQFDKDAANPPTPLAKEQYKIIRQWLVDGSTGDIELIQWAKGAAALAAGESYTFVLGGFSHPVSRGSIHINSTNPLAQPVIDPKFLSSDFDAQLLRAAVKFVGSMETKKPFSDSIAAKILPPSGLDDDALLSFVRASASGGSHLIGTAAMAPKDLGGVVDSNLHVYGTTNLRVVDASIFPMHIGHTQSTVYAIGEKAAAMILGSHY